MDMAGRVQDLAAFGASGQVRKLHLQPLVDTRECPGQNTFYSLKTNFPFHWLFSDLLLSGSDLERERELEFKERNKKTTVHRSLSPPMQHWQSSISPQPASEFSQIACLTAVMGSELFQGGNPP
jgi:hypothetical protein